MRLDIGIYLLVGILLILIVGIGVGIYYATAGPDIPIRGPRDLSPSPAVPTPGVPRVVRPHMSIAVRSPDSVMVGWSNLPEGTTHLLLFRKKPSENKWRHWKSIQLGMSDLTGSLSIGLSRGENAYQYLYYGEAVSGNGASLWISETIPPDETPPPPAPPGTPGGGGGETPPPSPEPTPSPTPNPTPPSPTPPTPDLETQSSSTGGATTPPSTPPQPTPPTPPGGNPPPTPIPSTVYYPSGAAAPPGSGAETFWVLHVNQAIELGWQTLPSGTTKTVVSRAPSSNGPWNTLLTQNTPVDPYFIRLVDDTLHEPHYYELKVFSGATTLATFGPLLLNPL